MTSQNSMPRYPLVSCIMATKNRQEFIPGAIRCFQAQTYPNIELVIVDHGSDGTREIVRSFGDERIRYEHIPDSEMLTGDVKNRAIANARGEYIAVWDDDDWHHPSRLMLQFETMRNSRADACFLMRLIFAWPDRDLYANSKRRLWEGTLLSRRHDMHPFGSMRRHEDSLQMDATIKSGKVVVYLDMPDLYIYRIHSGNVSGASHFEWRFLPGYDKLPAGSIRRVKRRLGVED